MNAYNLCFPLEQGNENNFRGERGGARRLALDRFFSTHGSGR